ncbi:hypothetical protein G7047_01485 [Diaphorobacter sp. HDW4A]|uniref:hypothetical protein n=1 Tax=Diaphorobacter sp. HDW4A TaxID=2714924 RepID=UPI001408A388|nr:hypothetical protein [Diaphorobacter sp. HDW4A]QIL78742.1 hypothetical protein G7047_01485 [Diaphorobacter sp. HDW4A]
MAIPWIAALKMVPWGEVIEAAPQVIKAAKGLVKKKDADERREEQVAAATASAERLSPPTSSGELALQQVQHLQSRIESLEQSQRQSLEIIEKLAEQNAQLVTTVSALRVGAQRLVWACAVLGTVSVVVVIYLVMNASKT